MKTIHSPKQLMMHEMEQEVKEFKKRNRRIHTLEVFLFFLCFFFTASIFAQTTASALILKKQNADISTVTKTGSAYAEGTATISWTVENENKFCVYVIEKSNDAETYIPFAKVIRREGENRTNYTYTDTKPWAGTGYYRLMVVYANGSYNYAPAGVINETTMESVSTPADIK